MSGKIIIVRKNQYYEPSKIEFEGDKLATHYDIYGNGMLTICANDKPLYSLQTIDIVSITFINK